MDSKNIIIDSTTQIMTDPEVGSKTSSNYDELQLQAQGHKQEMPRARFGLLSLFAIAFTMTSSWVGFSTSIGIGLLYGNTAAIIYGQIVAATACMMITLGLAELASAYPSSGGQYHYAYMIASPETRPFFAFITGWMSVLSWWILTGAGGVTLATQLFSLGTFWNDNFEVKDWQVYCGSLGILTLCCSIVLSFPTKVKYFETFTCYWCLLGFFIVFIVILAIHDGGFASNASVWNTAEGFAGWSPGFGFILGVSNSMFTYGAIDGATHMSEELPSPSINVPKAMILTMVVGFITTFPLSIAYMYTMSSAADVVDALLPAAELYYQATGNKTGSTILSMFIIITFVGAVTGAFMTSGRIAWAFARDHGAPFSGWVSKIHPRLQIPVNATLSVFCFGVIFGLLYLASTAVFNNIIAICTMFLNLTYIMPQALLLWRGRAVLPPRWLDLGRYGYWINLFNVVWVSFMTVIWCFPSFAAVEVSNMSIPLRYIVADLDYMSVVAVGVFVIGLIFWYTVKRKTFVGPEVSLQLLEQINARVIHQKAPESTDSGSVPST